MTPHYFLFPTILHQFIQYSPISLYSSPKYLSNIATLSNGFSFSWSFATNSYDSYTLHLTHLLSNSQTHFHQPNSHPTEYSSHYYWTNCYFLMNSSIHSSKATHNNSTTLDLLYYPSCTTYYSSILNYCNSPNYQVYS